MGPNGGRLRLSRQRVPSEFDSEGFFGIRLESIGGLGAHLAGQILAEAAVLRQGMNGSHFSSYGSEKKGSPVKSYVRLSGADRQLRTSSPIDRPQVVAIFHEALSNDPGVIDASRIAVEERSRVNTAMLGAIARVSPLLAPEAIEETIRATFERKYPQLVETNLRTFRRGYEELRLACFAGDGPATAAAASQPAPAFGYLEAPAGGVIVNPGNSILKDLSATRQGFIPAFDRSACVDCGLCDLACPDFCLVWGEEEAADGRLFIRLRGIDYQYCKGCLKCIDVCPTTALTLLREEEGYAEAHSVPLFPFLHEERSPLAARRNGTKGEA